MIPSFIFFVFLLASYDLGHLDHPESIWKLGLI
jgi:hypothetical protein